MLRFLRNMRIRYKLLTAYSCTFLFAFLVVGVVIYAQVRGIVQDTIEMELMRTTVTIQTMVRTAADVSVRNYMRAVAEKALDEARFLHREVRRGRLTEEEAKQRATQAFLSQRIGETGRVYCLDSNGIMVVHHKRSLLGVDLSGLSFVKEQIRRKVGFLEYDWKEPLERVRRSKAVYMTYFQPWDWIITASSYRDEFGQLVNVNDFRRRLFELGFGKSGYPFVLDYDGNMLAHPYLEGKHYSEYGEPELSRVAERIVTEKNGHFDYMWMNPGGAGLKKKVVYYKAIPELRWIVSSSSYYEDFQGPMDDVGYAFLIALLVAVGIMVPISIWIGEQINHPVKEMQESFAKAAGGDFSVRMHEHSRDELGHMAGYFNSFMEKLTEYSNNLENELAFRKETEKELIAMDKTRSLFLASASHELRTPLTSIIGFLKLMDRNFNRRFLPHLRTRDNLGGRAEQFSRNLAIVGIEADRLGRLVNDLLDMSKIESGRMEWREQTLFVNAVLKRAADSIAAFAAERADVRFEVETSMGDVVFYADPDRVHQVLINLLNNAFKFTEKGAVVLSGKAVPEGVEFSICDTGPGIPESDREKVFDIFYQVSDADQRSSGHLGTGLGLAICRQIVDHYGGSLSVSPGERKGSCFMFTIPTGGGRDGM